MSIRLPSASKAGLALACQFSFSSHAPRVPWEPSSPAAEHGNAVHALGEAIVEGREVECSAEVEPYRAPLAEASESLRREGWRLSAEVPIAYDPRARSARVLRKGGGHRAYSDVRASEMPGTADVVGGKPGRLIIADFKTGRGAREHSAIETVQMRVLAVAFAAAYKLDSAEVALIHVEPGDYRIDRCELFAWDLEESADQLAALMDVVDPVPQPGAHCTSMWCPIRAVCPATIAAVERINGEAARAFPSGMLEVDDDDKAKAARVALKLYDERSEALRRSLHDYVRHRGPIDMGDGTRYGLTVQERERVSLDVDAARLLADHGAADAIEYRTSKEAIKRALAARYPGRGKSTQRFRDLLEELRGRGSVSTSTFERFDTFKNDTKNEDEGEAA